jgi:diguanylate cyclase (GGDEF)-like protein
LGPLGTRKTAPARRPAKAGSRKSSRPVLARLVRLGRAPDFDPARFERAISSFARGGARAEILRRLLEEWVGLSLAPREAERVWIEVSTLFGRMRETLGSPFSLQTALLHHFHTRRKLLRDPHLVPGRDLERLRLSAITDPLTGLYNRRFLSESLARHLFRAGRSGDAVSVAVLDLQDFKSINDRFGHHTGDRALVCTADVMRGSLRPGDAACRWGGDEFVLVLPQADCLAAVSIAERIRRRIAIESRSLRAGLALDLYYGVASFPLDGRTADQLLAVADERLYDCREQSGFDGGNRRRYPRFALDRMRLRLLAGGAGFVAPVVNVGYGGLAFQAREKETVPSNTDAELSGRDQEAPRPIRISVKNTAKLPGGRVRVGCKYA